MTRAAIALLVALATAPSARAQDAVTRAREAFARAEFTASIEAYDEAAAGDGLTRDEVVELLRGRALSKHAANDIAGAERDLVALLSLEPDAALGDMAPPALQRAFARLQGEVRAPLALEVVAEPIPDGFRVRTAIREDVASLVREVRVHWREGDEWTETRGDDVRVLAGASLTYFVEAIGPGGAVLASEGSHDEPLEARAARVEVAADAAAEPSGADVPLIVGLSVGAAAVIAAVAIVLAVVLAPSGVQIGAPMEMR